MTYDDAVQELAATLERLGPHLLTEGDGALVSEFVLVAGYVTAAGAPMLDVVAPPHVLVSHTLGALEFGAEVIRDRIRSDNS